MRGKSCSLEHLRALPVFQAGAMTAGHDKIRGESKSMPRLEPDPVRLVRRTEATELSLG